MTKSLQDQLMGAGLIDSKKAKKITNENRKQKKVQKKSRDDSLSDAQTAAKQAQQEKIKRDQALNKKLNSDAQQKSIAAQVIQLINHYKLERKRGEISYNFSDRAVIKKILVSDEMSQEIARGRLCIARLGDSYELIPKPIADKIRERDQDSIVVYNEKPSLSSSKNAAGAAKGAEAEPALESDDDYYAQFEIPDDLTW
ncbi:MAG: hypothetical protein ACJA1S_002051 [Cellvibrionaceae bacterium]|jgi:uncharacterized protein YaiL (DUF2058 family)